MCVKFIEQFLNDFYSKINQASMFERQRSKVQFDETGNRPKIIYQINTGQFTEEFGDFYTDLLAKIFDEECVECVRNEVNPEYTNERTYTFHIYGDLDGLSKKANWYKTQGIEKSDNNTQQLIDLLYAHKDMILQGTETVDISLRGLFNRAMYIEFQPPYDYKSHPNALQKFAGILGMDRGGYALSTDENNKVNCFIIELERVYVLDALRSASRRGYRLP